MRIHLRLTPNSKPVPYDNLPYLVGAIHKWLGTNNIHNTTSLYSFSWLQGGEGTGRGLQFPRGSTFFISAHDDDFVRHLIRGMQKDPDINFGLEVYEVQLQDTPEFTGHSHFRLASPALVKRKIGEQEKHFVFHDAESDSLLTQTLQTKLRAANLSPEGVQVRFDRQYAAAKVKKVNYKQIGNKASFCPVIIEGTPEQIAFAWNVGVGNSTGIGFGALI